MHYAPIRLIPAGVLICGMSLAAQQPAPPPVFRARVDAIEVEMRVVDRLDRPVIDLKANEVEVFEDGRRQQIIGFRRVSVPVDAPSKTNVSPAAGAPADVVSNRGAAASRIFVLLLDDLHVDAPNSMRVKEVARSFVDRHVQPGDLVSVVYSSGNADAAQDFTSDRGLLLAAIDKFVGRKIRSATVERMQEYNLVFRGRTAPQFEDLRDKEDGARAFNARSALGSLENICSVLARVRDRRKAMIIFSEGIEYDLSGLRSRSVVRSRRQGPAAATPGPELEAIGRPDLNSHASDVLLSMQSAVGSAARANVTLYPIDLHHGDVSDALAALGAPLENPDLGLTPEDVAAEMSDAQATLWLLAENTGGFATLAASNYDGVFSRIVEESSEYYLLAYSPLNVVPDGRFRAISVNVRRPDTRVSARRGYYGPRGPSKRVAHVIGPGISEETGELAMAPLPSAGLSLELNTVALRGDTKADVIVTVQIDGQELAPESVSAVANTLEVALMAIDSAGRVQDAAGTAFDVRLDEQTTRIMRRAGYRSISRLRVPPGRYQIRAAVRERQGGRHGSVYGYVDVPDFSKRLGMSGVLLTSPSTGLVPTSIDAATQKRLRVMPAVRRTFPAGDRLSAALEVYNAPLSRNLHLTTTLVDGTRKEIYRRVADLDQTRVNQADGAYVHEVEIPLEKTMGELLLVIEASSGGQPVIRRVAFSVAPQG